MALLIKPLFLLFFIFLVASIRLLIAKKMPDGKLKRLLLLRLYDADWERR